jgi:phenol 2-monooxygenase (NADPH)
MQFHLNGFRAGDSEVVPSVVAAGTPAELPDTVDVLIVGCGPAGLVLAAQLVAFPEITTRIVERKAGPLELGQGDSANQAWGVMDVLAVTDFWLPDA